MQQHFSTTLAHYNQPDTFNLHVVFLRPATTGQVTLEIKALKLGGTTSTTRITLSQNGEDRVTALASYENESERIENLSLITNPRQKHEHV